MITTEVHMLGGPLDGKTVTLHTTIEWLPERISSGSYIYEQLKDPDTGAFLGGYFLNEHTIEGDIVASDIRRMPAPEFEHPKRRVPFKLYAAIVIPVGLLWFFLEDHQTREGMNFFTAVLVMTGTYTIANAIGRFIMNEKAIGKELHKMKDIK